MLVPDRVRRALPARGRLANDTTAEEARWLACCPLCNIGEQIPMHYATRRRARRCLSTPIIVQLPPIAPHA
ncbi:hypothetical protein PC116_g5651 [Phytophthora cactorum]|uniref:Uncharacterized protein n=1 Tax=Phytophthora cactorum TaxID=29920 RepID=A0A8T1DBJ3_9STRA|nr:hypothetical protein Pcac1_g26918 [Phytophthora cactorum]KAG2902571.1 hypothetical protein PC114_g12679 [Phytophthora cactorum]KAG2936110.1 hypothetical protein PC117_g12216 [Phytophthora cactorum]KAG3013844.1 hypothetical protein PC119_g12356 [Phytophthora cactorum]KAG3161947.1 hypothetical protein C6341_g13430 [Phytophthora cactorum]